MSTILELDDIKELAEGLLTRGAGLGIFDSVQGHEHQSAPDGDGLNLALFGAKMEPVGEISGLNSLSVRVEFQMNILRTARTHPADMIDPETMGAAGRLMNALAGGYTLNGQAIAIDLLGAYGEKLRAEAGYVTIGGGQNSGGNTFRVMSVFVPIILDDCWVLGE